MAVRVATYRRPAATLRERSEALAALITQEMGKTLAAARAEVAKCASATDWIAEHGPRFLADEPAPVEGDDQVHVSYLPIGSILAVMPWNFPLWRGDSRIGLSDHALGQRLHPQACRQCDGLGVRALQDAHEAAGFPVGLFANLNADNETVAHVIEDPRVAAVTLTGSMRAGSAVASTAGRALKKTLLEPRRRRRLIVLADANIDLAVKVAIEARFQNAGQFVSQPSGSLSSGPLQKSSRASS